MSFNPIKPSVHKMNKKQVKKLSASVARFLNTVGNYMFKVNNRSTRTRFEI